MQEVDLSKIPSFYHKYVALVTEDNLQKAFHNHQVAFSSFLQTIPADKWLFRYAEEKWSIKEMVQHLIDAERIFCYRALTFARKDAIQLPGFDENKYVASSKADKREVQDLIEETELVQKASAKLFNSFDEEQLNETGVMNGNSIYVKAIGYIIIGHCRHHINIIKERYL